MESRISVQFIIPLVTPVNRKEKRIISSEFVKLSEHYKKIEALENQFYDELFSENEYSYDYIYNHYLLESIALCESIESICKPKYHKLNSYYFNDIFRPLENSLHGFKRN